MFNKGKCQILPLGLTQGRLGTARLGSCSAARAWAGSTLSMSQPPVLASETASSILSWVKRQGIKGRDYHNSLSSHNTTEKTASTFSFLPLSLVKDRPCQTAGKFSRRLPGQLDLEHVPWEGRLRERSCSVRGRRGYRGQNSNQRLRRQLRKTERLFCEIAGEEVTKVLNWYRDGSSWM